MISVVFAEDILSEVKHAAGGLIFVVEDGDSDGLGFVTVAVAVAVAVVVVAFSVSIGGVIVSGLTGIVLVRVSTG